MTTENTPQDGQTSPTASSPDPALQVVVVAEAPPQEPQNTPAHAGEIPPVIAAAEIEAVVVDTVIDVVVPVVEHIAQETHENTNDLEEVKKWQTEAQQILEGQTAAIQSIQQAVLGMGETLTALLQTASPARQSTQPVSSEDVADPPEAAPKPEDQPPQDNKLAKSEAKSKRSWV